MNSGPAQIMGATQTQKAWPEGGRAGVKTKNAGA
jgi:hypothetical protein